MSNCKCGGSWRTDGQHSNEFCAKCFASRPRRVGMVPELAAPYGSGIIDTRPRDPYNSVATPPTSDVLEFQPSEHIEVITLCDPETRSS